MKTKSRKTREQRSVRQNTAIEELAQGEIKETSAEGFLPVFDSTLNCAYVNENLLQAGKEAPESCRKIPVFTALYFSSPSFLFDKTEAMSLNSQTSAQKD